MQAIVEIAGKQHKLAPKDKVRVPLLKEEPGKKVSFARVLLISDGESVMVGKPTVKGASVEATVLGRTKGDKVIVFKKKRRKGYRVRKGHRQQYSEIEITNIVK
jgi:large subunit ribosomal protein L21